MMLKSKQDFKNIVIKKIDDRVYQQVKRNWDNVAKPLNGLGRFEEIIARIGAITGTDKVSIKKRAVITMCADNGIVNEGVSQSGQEVTSIVTEFMGKNASSVGKMAKVAGADIFPVDIGINTELQFEGVIQHKVAMGTRDFLVEPAMTTSQVLEAIGVGIDMVKQLKNEGYELIGTGEMGIGNTTTSSAIAAVLMGCSVESVTGRGAGLSDSGLCRKIQVIKQAIEKYGFTEKTEALEVLSTVGGLDIAGLTGVFIGGAVYGLPIVIDGVISAVAALLAEALVPGTKDFMLASHKSKEPAANEIFNRLGVYPVIDGQLALGEGTGTVMLFSLLDVAMALYESDTSFGEMQIEQYERYQ